MRGLLCFKFMLLLLVFGLYPCLQVTSQEEQTREEISDEEVRRQLEIKTHQELVDFAILQIELYKEQTNDLTKAENDIARLRKSLSSLSMELVKGNKTSKEELQSYITRSLTEIKNSEEVIISQKETIEAQDKEIKTLKNITYIMGSITVTVLIVGVVGGIILFNVGGN